MFEVLEISAVLIGKFCVNADVNQLADLFLDLHFLQLLIGPFPRLFGRLELLRTGDIGSRRCGEKGADSQNKQLDKANKTFQHLVSFGNRIR